MKKALVVVAVFPLLFGAAYSGQIETVYKEGISLLQAENYDGAIEKFEQILSESRTHSLSDNAQYWLGECYYSKLQFARAKDEFLKVLDFPKSNKTPDAILKVGLCYKEMGEIELARYYLVEVISFYPELSVAKRGIEELKTLMDKK